jgi:hypothetical protein
LRRGHEDVERALDGLRRRLGTDSGLLERLRQREAADLQQVMTQVGARFVDRDAQLPQPLRGPAGGDRRRTLGQPFMRKALGACDRRPDRPQRCHRDRA